MLELLECRLAATEGNLRPRHRFLGNLEPARILVAARLEVPNGFLEPVLRPRAALVAATETGLEAVSQGPFVAVQVVQLLVADRGGRAEELLAGNPGQVGYDLRGPGGIGIGLAVERQSHPAALTAVLLLQHPREGDHAAGVLVLFLDHEFEPDARALVSTGPPALELLDFDTLGGRLSEEGQFETALDGRFACLVGTPDDREARRQSDVQVAMAADPVELQAQDPHRGRPPARITRRVTTSPGGLREGGVRAAGPRACRPRKPVRRWPGATGQLLGCPVLV